MSTSLNCPTCGAPAAGPDASRCDYCTSTLTYAACPACFGPMFVGMEFCPRCGARSDRQALGDSALACPSCKTPMAATRVGATQLTECASCSGDWLDSATFTSVCSSKEERGRFAADFGGRGHARAPAMSRVVYLPCPVCTKLMARENFGRRSGVVIDVCRGHGVWLQQGELHAVLAFIESGGLERAREAERRQKAEEARLARLTATPAAPRGDGHFTFGHVDTPDDESPLLSALRSLLG